MSISLSEISTPALAYLGDSVLELCVREMLVDQGISSSKRLNSAALSFVRAETQANAMIKILPVLSEEESAVYRRGRNVGHTNVPKNATVGQYRIATGMETLFGYLHLLGRGDRIRELFSLAYKDQIASLDTK